MSTSSSSDASLITALNSSLLQVNRYIGIFIFVFGVVGNAANILVLSQRALRSNPCAWLFLTSSIANFIGVTAGLISRFLSTWAADLTNTNQFLCKFRAFLLFNGITIAAWLIALATLDRWLSSSRNAHRRQQSTLKNAQRGTILIVVLSTMIETLQLYCFEANLINTPLKCYTKTLLCGLASDLVFALVSILCPSMLMFIFGLMTILNVRQVQSRLQPATITIKSDRGRDPSTANSRTGIHRKKSDRHLLAMLLLQVLLILAFTLPMAIYKLYTNITRDVSKSALERTIENYIFNVFLLLVYVSCGMPFYIYTLSGGSLFRKTLLSLFESLRRKMLYTCR